MSTYANYQTASQSYDTTRGPVGVEILLGCLSTASTPISELTLLDAGCGTGNYSQAVLPHVRHIDAIDLNPGMLAIAHQKFAPELNDGRITLNEASIDDLPFENASFDAIMVNQVLHHLEADNTTGYPKHQRVIQEFSRVLRPGGRLIINTCTHEQLSLGYWYDELLPDACRKLQAKYIEMDILREFLETANFQLRDRIVPLDAVLQGEAYFEPQNVIDPMWRAGDSTFALLDDTELETLLATVEKMIRNGQFQSYFEERDRRRQNVGQCVFVVATKE